MARRASHSLVGDAFLAVVALAVFVGALAFQKGVPAASVVSSQPAGKAPHAIAKTTSNPNISTVAEAIVPKVAVFDSESAANPSKTLDNPQPSGATWKRKSHAWCKPESPPRGRCPRRTRPT